MFSRPASPDWEAFVACLRRAGTPRRVHHIELFLDQELQDAIVERFDLARGIRSDDPFLLQKVKVALQRFLGYDYVTSDLDGFKWIVTEHEVADTAERARTGGRAFVDLKRGPITSWKEFESYPWPDPDLAPTRSLEWYQENLPDDMCLIGGLTSHYGELLSWLMGYETLCYALVDQRDLVEAIAKKVDEGCFSARGIRVTSCSPGIPGSPRWRTRRAGCTSCIRAATSPISAEISLTGCASTANTRVKMRSNR
jgi:uroporphyrinogen decarboxylase